MKLLRIISFIILFSGFSGYSQNVVTIPNIFTPNGDGDNDVFQIRDADSFDKLTCTVFNRYGEPVYRFFGINGSWDGYTHAGVKVSAGVYFILLEVAASDGEVKTQQATLQVHY